MLLSMVIFKDPRTVLKLMGIWASFGLMLWLLANLWPVLLGLGG